MKKMSVAVLLISVLLPLLIGGISAAISSQGMAEYRNMIKPPLSPPAWVFSVAWTVLYIMMGLASYFILTADTELRNKAMSLTFYMIQLVMNFMWSIIFFNWHNYMLAFIWLIIMWIVVICCAVRFFSISRVAAFLLIPYILWLTFAAYLNLSTYMLNTNR